MTATRSLTFLQSLRSYLTSPAVALVLILLAGGALRLAAAQRPLWIDEIYRLAWSKGCDVVNFHDVSSATLCINKGPRRTRDVLRVTRPYEPAPTALLLNRWMRASGARSDLGIRLPLVAISELGLVGVALLGRELAGTRLGLAAATLVSLSPLHVYYGAELNNYALACSLVIFSYLFYFRLFRVGVSALDTVGYVLCTVAALLTHYYALIVFGAQGLAVPAGTGLAWRPLLRMSIPFLLVAAGFALYLPVLLSQLPYMLSMVSGVFGGLETLGRWLRTVPLYPWLWEQAGLLGPTTGSVGALFMVALVLAGLRTMPDAPRRRVLAVNVFAPIAIVAAIYLVRANNQILWPRYGLFFTAPALVATAGVWARPRWRAGAWLSALVVTLVLGEGLFFLFAGGFHRNWRAAAGIIAEFGEPDEPVFVHLANLVYALGRYLPPDRRMHGVLDGLSMPLEIASDVETRRGAWAVFAWDDGSPGRARLRSLLTCQLGIPTEYALSGIRVLHFRADPDIPSPCKANGFDLGDAGCWAPPAAADIDVRGWIEIGAPSAIAVVVDGKDAVAAGVDQPAAVERSVPGGSPATRFERRVDIGMVPDGSVFWLGVRASVADGSESMGRLSVPCVKRSRAAMDGAPGPARVAGFVDEPQPSQRFVHGDRIPVSGWMFATQGVREVVLSVDGRERARSRQHGFARLDVRAAFPEVDPELATHSGFIANIETAGLQPGIHAVAAAAVHPDGTFSAFGTPRQFEIILAARGAGAANP